MRSDDVDRPAPGWRMIFVPGACRVSAWLQSKSGDGTAGSRPQYGDIIPMRPGPNRQKTYISLRKKVARRLLLSVSRWVSI